MSNFYQVANNMRSHLALPHAIGDGALTLVSAASFPEPTADNPIRVTVGSSIYKITNKSGNVLTIDSAIEGTSDVAHAAGTPCEMRFTAGHLQDIHNSFTDNPDFDTVSLAAPTMGNNARLTINPNHTTDNDAVVQISTDEINQHALVLQTMPGHIATVLEIQDSTGATTFSLGANGAISMGGNLAISGTSPRSITYDRGSNLDSTLDFNIGSISTALGLLRFFRFTNTTGNLSITVHAGDGTSTAQHRLGCRNLNSYFAANAGYVGIGTIVTPSAMLEIRSRAATDKGLIVRAVASQSVNHTEWQASNGNLQSAMRQDGSYKPAHLADSAAVNDSFYYSTTQSKPAYKDSAGNVWVMVPA
jgi:hypothetical protein